MDSEWMNAIAAGIAAGGVHVLRFEFPYMAARRTTGHRRPPDRQPVLLDTWRSAFAASSAPRTFIGGKSMGGRMASMVADELGPAGLVCLGYPFHAPGKPEAPRIAHLQALQTPALVVQGTSDPFGTRQDVDGYHLAPAITIEWLEAGNHDLVTKGLGKAASRQYVVAAVLRFLASRT
jgi:predicted alpha/beta-hydrolase family hydrolase